MGFYGVDAGQLIASKDFQGRRGCPLVHKIVEFELPAQRDLVLQFAGGSAPEAGVAITAVTAPARRVRVDACSPRCCSAAWRWSHTQASHRRW